MKITRKLILFSTISTVIIMFLLTITINRVIKADRREQIYEELKQVNQVVSEYCVLTNTADYDNIIGNFSSYITIYIIGETEVNIYGNLHQGNNDAFSSEDYILSLSPKTIHEEVINGEIWAIYTDKLSLDGNDYTVATVAFDSTVLALTGKITKTIALLAVISCLALSVLLSFLSSKTISPFRPIMVGVKQFSKKNFDYHINVKTKDEFGFLSEELNRMAQSLNEMDLTEKKFYEDYSHDIKTPLTVISGYIEELRTGVITNQENTYLLVEEECAKLKKYIENMIYLSKLETARHTVPFEKLNINDVISSALTQLDSLIILSNLDIEFEVKEPLFVNGNKEQLERAFVNIFSNCLRFANSVIHIDCDTKQSSIHISISDDGEGFPTPVLENPFERNRSGHNQGSGIGLSIIQKIIHLHGGSFTIENAVNGGANYLISLPTFCHK